MIPPNKTHSSTTRMFFEKMNKAVAGPPVPSSLSAAPSPSFRTGTAWGSTSSQAKTPAAAPSANTRGQMKADLLHNFLTSNRLLHHPSDHAVSEQHHDNAEYYDDIAARRLEERL